MGGGGVTATRKTGHTGIACSAQRLEPATPICIVSLRGHWVTTIFTHSSEWGKVSGQWLWLRWFWPLEDSNKWRHCLMFLDFRQTVPFRKVPSQRPFVLLVRGTCRRRWVWSIGGMILAGENRIKRWKLWRIVFKASSRTAQWTLCYKTS
jgi:hypothetical protein